MQNKRKTILCIVMEITLKQIDGNNWMEKIDVLYIGSLKKALYLVSEMRVKINLNSKINDQKLNF